MFLGHVCLAETKLLGATRPVEMWQPSLGLASTPTSTFMLAQLSGSGLLPFSPQQESYFVGLLIGTPHTTWLPLLLGDQCHHCPMSREQVGACRGEGVVVIVG